MPSRSGGRYEIRDGEPMLVERTDGPQPHANPDSKTRAPSAPAEVAPTTEEDTDDADA